MSVPAARLYDVDVRWVPAAGLAVVLLGGCAEGGLGAGSVVDAQRETPASAGSGSAAGTAADGREVGQVVRIVDGDTLYLRGDGDLLAPGGRDGTAVRLLQIDTPETVAPSSPVECWGPEASAALADLVPPGASVSVEADEELLDRYDRVLLYVYDAGGAMVNLAMVRAGHAEAVLYEPNDRHIERMRSAEDEAREAGRGLWSAC